MEQPKHDSAPVPKATDENADREKQAGQYQLAGKPGKKPNWLLRTLFLIAIVALIGVLGYRFAGHSGARDGQPGAAGKGGAPREELVPVSVAAVTQRDIPIQIQATGNVEAYTNVAVRSQVTGELTNVFFKQGDDVKKGQPLFSIDPRPLQEALNQARAQLEKDTNVKRQNEKIVAKDQAQLRNAEKEAQRYAELAKVGVVSREQAEQFQTNSETFAATMQADQATVKTTEDAIKSDEAAVKNAEVQLSFATIRAPIDGRTGSLQVNQGNLVRANDTTPMVVINQITPIYVSFTVPERELPRIRGYQSQSKLKVGVALPGNDSIVDYGELTFIENSVDLTTGTIRLRATFDNAQRLLWPGQFVNVQITLATQPNVLVVPSQAVQIGQSGAFVYVVKPDQTVESRTVTPGTELAGVTVIDNGLNLNDQVVTDGQLRLVPGAKVTIKPAAPEGQKPGSKLAENNKQ